MKFWLYYIVLSLVISFSGYAAKNSSEEVAQTVNSSLGQYSIHIVPKSKKIEVKRIKGSENQPPHLRLRVLRKDKKPLDIRLHTLNTLKVPTYSGHLDQWDSSYIGLELEFSFDAKKWTKLK